MTQQNNLGCERTVIAEALLAALEEQERRHPAPPPRGLSRVERYFTQGVMSLTFFVLLWVGATVWDNALTVREIQGRLGPIADSHAMMVATQANVDNRLVRLEAQMESHVVADARATSELTRRLEEVEQYGKANPRRKSP